MSRTRQSVQMDASLRECRMVFERLMHVANVEPGLVPSLRDAALFSVALGLSRFETLLETLVRLDGADGKGAVLDLSAGQPVLDAHGLHGWIVAEPVVDLAVERLRLGEGASVIVRNVTDPDQLGVVKGFAARFGHSATIAHAADGGVAVTLHRRPGEDILQRIRDHGLPVDTAVWWALFHRANDALVPDSFDSRRHAGPIVVEADGRVVGREDEDPTDLTLLGVAHADA